jgi:hypothetical protein
MVIGTGDVILCALVLMEKTMLYLLIKNGIRKIIGE